MEWLDVGGHDAISIKSLGLGFKNFNYIIRKLSEKDKTINVYSEFILVNNCSNFYIKPEDLNSSKKCLICEIA
jgi:hypothetical protein